jgi:pimeloyl-ACP methyl ester carboxylesterase
MKTALLVVSVALATMVAAPSFAAEDDTNPQTTVVLVHGAFADGASWSKVIPLLQAKGLKVVAVQNPLSSLADDVTATRRVIDAQAGPVVLVGHSWGGTVITEAGNHDKVKALVYVAAFAPSAGESTADGGKGFPPPPGLAHPIASADGYLTLSPETVAQDFAQDVTRQEANLIAVTQGPINAANFDAKVTKPAWDGKPSWYIVAAKDRMIQPDAERAFAKKIKATTTELPTSHVPMVSQPAPVADVIVAAAKAIGQPKKDAP